MPGWTTSTNMLDDGRRYELVDGSGSQTGVRVPLYEAVAPDPVAVRPADLVRER